MKNWLVVQIHTACIALALAGLPAHAEVSELNVAQQYGVSFLRLMWIERVFQFAEFMHKIGAVKEKPASWKDLFFPEIHDLPGS